MVYFCKQTKVDMNKKLFYIMLTLCMICLKAYPQGYFYDKEGGKLEYVRKQVKDGSVVWRFTGTITKVADSGTYKDITTESVFTKPNGKPLYSSSVIQMVRVDNETNEVSVDVAGAMASYIKARAGLTANCTKVYSTLKADAKPGDELESVFAQAKVGPLTYNLAITERKILRRETLSVPAGTFDCIVLYEHKKEDGPGHHRDVINHSWYCKGVGYVRHDSYIDGKLDTSEILYSIK